jgi:CRISPR/Cas system-associated exonuclease Cas4 (RecB family)
MLDKRQCSNKLEHMSDKLIRASEIAEYVYCRRSWWLRRVGGYRSRNVREMAAGTAYHQQHGQVVAEASWWQRAALILLFLAVVLIIFALVQTA